MKTQYLLIIFIMLFGFAPFSPFCGEIAAQEVEDSLTDSLAVEDTAPKKLSFTFQPSLGLTFGKSKFEESTSQNYQWQISVNSELDYQGETFQLSSSLFAQYGQTKPKDSSPETLMDALILSITPSIPLIRKPAIRLFLETTGETKFSGVDQGDGSTGFIDPIFLYQTLFVGQRHFVVAPSANTSFELTYGFGYAFQQTLRRNFTFVENENSNPDFETGYSGVIDLSFTTKVKDAFDFSLNAKAVTLSRNQFNNDFGEWRSSVLIRSGLFYKMFGAEYTYHLVRDKNISLSDQVEQSLMLSIRFN